MEGNQINKDLEAELKRLKKAIDYIEKMQESMPELSEVRLRNNLQLKHLFDIQKQIEEDVGNKISSLEEVVGRISEESRKATKIVRDFDVKVQFWEKKFANNNEEVKFVRSEIDGLSKINEEQEKILNDLHAWVKAFKKKKWYQKTPR